MAVGYQNPISTSKLVRAGHRIDRSFPSYCTTHLQR